MKWKYTALFVAVVISISISGCSDENARVAQVATQAADRQARQNQEMSDLNREVAKAHQELIKEEASSRQDAMVVHTKLVEQQAELNRQSQSVDDERRDLAKQRYWEPIWAEIISDLAALAACVLPLVVCAYLLHRSPAPGAADEISEVLLDQLDPAPRIGLHQQSSLNLAGTSIQPGPPSS
jgi:outer membrane murein-binding lipoprotein Lpp